MIICISGFCASGKNAAGEYVAEKLGMRLVSPTFKDLAKAEGITLMEFQERAAQSKDGEIDRKFDLELRRQANDGHCVITTWLGPWIVENADLRVWLYAAEAVRAKRLAAREKISTQEALMHIRKRDEGNVARYKKVYGIDITAHDDFDLQIDVESLSAQQVAQKIIDAAMEKGAAKGKKQGKNKR
ncbi:cytidylate kinase family protein [Candidatus Micrarchaeota archaeon]|nr:cytidylate kinase family protein [Candidatus Micrarchaeota archaeon]